MIRHSRIISHAAPPRRRALQKASASRLKNIYLLSDSSGTTSAQNFASPHSLHKIDVGSMSRLRAIEFAMNPASRAETDYKDMGKWAGNG